MKVKVFSLSEKGLRDNDYRSILKITIDGEEMFEVGEGEPEDATLSRDFNDCWRVPSLIKAAYRAGLSNEKLEIERVTVDSWDDILEKGNGTARGGHLTCNQENQRGSIPRFSTT